ncbi:uncharacterized protein [Penaeus vannamei]|uniref:uncharacterized protein n=1 Tax=Penaeus vannamei TaxID=6689 RepID=UPI00387FA182
MKKTINQAYPTMALEKMVPMIVALMTVMVPHYAEATTTQPSVMYIPSPTGNFFMASGKAIPTDNASVVLPSGNLCHCKSLCWTNINCEAGSLVPLADGAAECRLAYDGPHAYEVEDIADAKYFFLESSIAGSYDFEPDNLLYLRPAELDNYDNAKRFCAMIPGHRLAMFKTMVQFDIVEPHWRPSSEL